MALRNIADLDAVPESQLDAGDYIRRVYGVFPNFQISGIRGGHFLNSQILPGPTPTTSTTNQPILTGKQLVTEEEMAECVGFSGPAREAGGDEDYTIGCDKLGRAACRKKVGTYVWYSVCRGL